MKRSTRQQLLAEARAMQRTGRQIHPDEERPVGAALSARLPQIIATAAERAKLGTRRGRIPR